MSRQELVEYMKKERKKNNYRHQNDAYENTITKTS